MKIKRVLKARGFEHLFNLGLLDFLKGLSKDMPLLFFSSEVLRNPYLNSRLGISDDFALFIGKDEGRIHLFLPFMVPSRKDKGNLVYHKFSELKPFLLQYVEKGGKLGLDFSKTRLSVLSSLKEILDENLSLVDVSHVMDGYFSLKRNDEINKIRQACALTDKVFNMLVKDIKKRNLKSENEVYEFIREMALKHSAGLAFSPIVANAENSSYIHYPLYAKKGFKKGFLLVDFGLRYEGFSSDMTRMFYLGEPSMEEVELFGFVKDLKNKCINQSSNVSSAKELQGFAQSIMQEEGFDMEHAIGHGLGALVHEPLFFFSSSSKANVFAVEPGIYLKGRFGIRVEDTVLLKDSPERLTKSDDGLIVVH
jgi:Xaa-Pro aminopeptidase